MQDTAKNDHNLWHAHLVQDSVRSRWPPAGTGWRTFTKLGALLGALSLANCGGKDQSTTAGMGTDASAPSTSNAGGSTTNTGSGGTQGNSTDATQGSDGATGVEPVAYAECGAGMGGCPALDPMCVDEQGSVSDVTGAGMTSQRFEVCTRTCETDSDCPTDLETNTLARCVELEGTNMCMLDCSNGARCPEGMACSWQDQGLHVLSLLWVRRQLPDRPFIHRDLYRGLHGPTRRDLHT